MLYADGLKLMRVAACKTVCPQYVVEKIQFCKNGRAINLILLINDSNSLFWVWISGTECSTVILITMQ